MKLGPDFGTRLPEIRSTLLARRLCLDNGELGSDFTYPVRRIIEYCLLADSLCSVDWVIIFSSSAVLISGYVLRVLLTSVGQSRDGGQ